ncbi:hypothetical protein Strain138_002124 [Pseudogemmatithrix spongiicola]|uniref:Uncharacterized protein n=1 Tax=Pseudogemmatithrix spongiicola TaxID=3062599 RepID=A0AA49K117_9BACT|nr:hypothetical protein Strain138_002124 [Gemmatimonadaceae bacterium 'strain 138']WKW15721.1 hypothetical protein Strain318_002123 [Gemmatimonadaceae bacterium 'strain 318']
MKRQTAIIAVLIGTLLFGAEVAYRERDTQKAGWQSYVASTSISARVRTFVEGTPNPFRGNKNADSLNRRCRALIDSLGIYQKERSLVSLMSPAQRATLPPPARTITVADSLLLAAETPCDFAPLPSQDFRADTLAVSLAFLNGCLIGLVLLVPLAIVATYSSRGWRRVAIVTGVAGAAVAASLALSDSSRDSLFLVILAAASGASFSVIVLREGVLWIRRGFHQD